MVFILPPNLRSLRGPWVVQARGVWEPVGRWKEQILAVSLCDWLLQRRPRTGLESASGLSGDRGVELLPHLGPANWDAVSLPSQFRHPIHGRHMRDSDQVLLFSSVPLGWGSLDAGAFRLDARQTETFSDTTPGGNGGGMLRLPATRHLLALLFNATAHVVSGKPRTDRHLFGYHLGI